MGDIVKRVLGAAVIMVALVLGMAPTAQAGGSNSSGWREVRPESPWEARAGLQAVNLHGQILLMGGRTPTTAFYNDQPVFGASIVYNDVWGSRNNGKTWKPRTEQAPWAARAYFKAVKHRGAVYVLGGQNFKYGDECLPPGGIPGGVPGGIPEGVGGPPAGIEGEGGPPAGLVPTCSDFFNDVWKSRDGVTWVSATSAAPWEGRAGLSAWSHRGFLYVAGGSTNDDSAIVGPGGPARKYFDDVWRSRDGVDWTEVNADAPWEARAGAATAVKGKYTYLLGGEDGFTCASGGDRCPPYFNDVWRTKNGSDWSLVTDSAGFSPRPGHQCLTVRGEIICFGGFGLPESSLAPPDPTQPFDPTACIGEAPANPTDMWASRDGKNWRKLADNAWGSSDPADMRYDFAAVVAWGWGGPAILTFGGDQETFCFADPENVERVVDDVWSYRPEKASSAMWRNWLRR